MLLRLQDPIFVITLRSPDATSVSRFTLRVSGNPASSTRGQTGVGIALSVRAEKVLLYWNPVNSRLCGVQLDGSVNVNNSQLKRRWLIVVSLYAPIEYNSHEAKDQFYRELPRLPHNLRSTDVVVDAVEFLISGGTAHHGPIG